jgi:hypothetical protein
MLARFESQKLVSTLYGVYAKQNPLVTLTTPLATKRTISAMTQAPTRRRRSPTVVVVISNLLFGVKVSA